MDDHSNHDVHGYGRLFSVMAAVTVAALGTAAWAVARSVGVL